MAHDPQTMPTYLRAVSPPGCYRLHPPFIIIIGRLASEEVMVQLLKHKCLPILLYALEVCNLDKRILQSLDFTVNRFFYEVVQDI